MSTIPVPTAVTSTVYRYTLDPPLPVASRYSKGQTYGIVRVNVTIDHATGRVVDLAPIGHVLTLKGTQAASSRNDRRYVDEDALIGFVNDARTRQGLEIER